MNDANHADMLRDSVRRMLAVHGRSGHTDNVELLWALAREQGLTELGADGARALGDLLVVMEELGRVGSSLPIIESALANIFAPGLLRDGDMAALAVGDAGGDIGAGYAERADGTISGSIRLVEANAGTQCFLVLTRAGHLCAVPAGAGGVAIRRTPALLDGLVDLEIDNVAAPSVLLDASQREELLAIARLAQCARAIGAARQGFEMVVDYAGTRKQFGQSIGSFQAIQHKLADSHTLIQGCALQLAGAARSWDGETADWWPRALSAVAFTCGALRKVVLETQHCFGAVGFAEEHPAPALFRRVHGDLVRLGGATRANLALADHILADAGGLRTLLAAQDDRSSSFRETFRRWLAANWTEADRTNLRQRPFPDRNWDLAFAERLGAGGWTTLNWPAEAGGLGASPQEQLAYAEELLAAGTNDHPVICGCRVMAPEIIAHGTDALQAAMLPGLRSGKFTGCLGYSEPEAGSDLASLRTKAERDGDDYRINGQKIWTTDGHRASHMLLAARTHPDPTIRHGGISLFVVPMDSPGITVQPMPAMYGHSFCSIFLDDVRVPAANRLGSENGGWAILAGALANERIAMAGLASQLGLLLETFVDHLVQADRIGPCSHARERLGALASATMTGRLLAEHSIEGMASSSQPLVDAAIAKVFGSELAQHLCETALDLLGGTALLGADAEHPPLDGRIEQLLRTSIMYVVGGGTNEIQRGLIAQRGLGLSR